VSNSEKLRLGLTSKGSYEKATIEFLDRAGLSVWRPNPRQYVGRIGELPDVEVLFQRTEDIVHKVADGSIDLGITGYDLVAEHGFDSENLFVVMPDLGFRRCELILAIPEGWLDIASMADLADLSVDFKRTGRSLRVATKFPNLTREFLHRHGVNYFNLVDAHGALEAAPTLGYADVIADLSETGVTLRDNRLRVIDGGVILKAQASLIASLRTLRNQPAKLEAVRSIVEMSESRLRSRKYRIVTANVQGDSAEQVARHVNQKLETAGEQGPTIADVFSKESASAQRWYEVRVIVPSKYLLAAVDHLREAGSRGITVNSPDYVFDSCSLAFEQLCNAIEEYA
jgi:ATP phosphoribosyltransferase